MNEVSNAPQFDATPPPPEPFYQIWIRALTRPSEQTYAELANSPGASANKAYLWIFLTGLISSLASVAIQTLFLPAMGTGQDYGGFTGIFGGSIIFLFCSVPISAGLSVLGFIISAGLVQWVAGLFKGTGNFNQLAYVFGTFTAPISLISTILSFFIAIPFAATCLWPLIIGLVIFALVLEVMAVKGVNKFGWGESIGSVLAIPGLLFLCSCLVITVLMLTGPVIGNVFSTINSSLGN